MVQGRGIDICVSWLCVPGDVEYIVTITDTEISTTPNCTSPGLNPPCVVARDTVSDGLLTLAVHKRHFSFNADTGDD